MYALKIGTGTSRKNLWAHVASWIDYHHASGVIEEVLHDEGVVADLVTSLEASFVFELCGELIEIAPNKTEVLASYFYSRFLSGHAQTVEESFPESKKAKIITFGPRNEFAKLDEVFTEFNGFVLEIESVAAPGANASKIAQALVTSLNLTAAREILKVHAASSHHNGNELDFDDGEVVIKEGGTDDVMRPLDRQHLHSDVAKLANDYILLRSKANVGKRAASFLLALAFFDLILKRIGEVTTIFRSGGGQS